MNQGQSSTLSLKKDITKVDIKRLMLGSPSTRAFLENVDSFRTLSIELGAEDDMIPTWMMNDTNTPT